MLNKLYRILLSCSKTVAKWEVNYRKEYGLKMGGKVTDVELFTKGDTIASSYRVAFITTKLRDSSFSQDKKDKKSFKTYRRCYLINESDVELIKEGSVIKYVQLKNLKTKSGVDVYFTKLCGK